MALIQVHVTLAQEQVQLQAFCSRDKEGGYSLAEVSAGLAQAYAQHLALVATSLGADDQSGVCPSRTAGKHDPIKGGQLLLGYLIP